MSILPLNLMDWTGFTNFPALEQKLQTAGWGRPDYLASLYTYAKRMRHPGLIVEIGTQRGESTVVMGHAIRHTGSHILTIDPVFRPDGAHYRDEHQGALFDKMDWYGLMETIKEQRLEGYITLVPDYSYNVLARWDGRPIDLLFVDGAHTYADVLKDCQWMEYVRPGNFAVFDDWFHEIEQAVKFYLQGKPHWHFLHESIHQKTVDYCVTILRRDLGA